MSATLPSGRTAALDVGDRRIGIAVGDPTGFLARAAAIVDAREGAAGVLAVLDREECVRVVVGLPRNMDGTEGPQARKVRRFAEQLAAARPGLEIHFWDERLSSQEASLMVRRSGAKAKERRGPVDDVAAAIILQAFLDARRNALPEGRA